MHELWSSASYEPHLLSLPFALAPAAMLIVIAYAAVMRGAPILRGFLLAHAAALLPYATVMMLSPSIAAPAVAEAMFRFAAAFIPLAAATGTGFQIALLGDWRRRRRLAYAVVGSSLVWVYLGLTSDALIDGIRRMHGFWYGSAGPWVWLAMAHTLVITVPSFAAMAHAAITRPPSDERRQLRATLLANAVTWAGLSDVALAYGVGVLPLGWLLSGVGCLLVLRALVVEDLLRARAVHTGAPLLIVYFAAASLLGWVALDELGAPLPWPLTTLALVLCFAAVRVGVASVSLVNRGARGGEGPLERLLAQLVTRARATQDAGAIAQLAIDVIELGLGVRARVLLASQSDWGWTTPAGERLDEARAPDPLLAGWLVEQRAVFGDDLGRAPADLQPLVSGLLAAHDAGAVVPVGSADELLAVVLVPALRGPGVDFVRRTAERLAEALLHARLAIRAAERAAIAREVELAATVQAELLPGPEPHVHGPLTVIGSWRPATRCAGDFWTVQPLGDAVLIAVGDVTGHGVASAMVAAAALGACEVCVRRRGAALELGELVIALDAAVRRVGGGELALTCTLAIIDPGERQLRFTSCGHPAPYLCRAGADRPIELHALVSRHDPLGVPGRRAPVVRVQTRALAPGDLLVWYTDGVVDAQDPSGVAFGERTLQHLLKRLDPAKLAASAVHAQVLRGVAAHRSGRPPADDETLVVAQLEAAS